MLTRVMAAEWGPFNVQTNAVAPTVVFTDMGKKAWGDEEKSAPADFICGQVVFIDGGYSAV